MYNFVKVFFSPEPLAPGPLESFPGWSVSTLIILVQAFAIQDRYTTVNLLLIYRSSGII